MGGSRGSPGSRDVAWSTSSVGAEEPVVNTGFASFDDPGEPIDRFSPLTLGAEVYFWFEIGDPVEGSIDREKTSFRVDDLPPKARLHVALFFFEGELTLAGDAGDVGELELQTDRTVEVVTPVEVPPAVRGTDLPGRRLFFAVRAPAETTTGIGRLRCNVYYRQVLLQSHLVSARLVEGVPASLDQPALETVLDYKISDRLRAEQFTRIEEHRLSLMLNDNGDGTHGFRFFGGDGDEVYKSDAAIPATELTTQIRTARAKLRLAAWGDEGEWNKQSYQYQGGLDLVRLRRDLIELAKWGRRFYVDLVKKIVDGGAPEEVRREKKRLAKLMRSGGRVQIASKDSLRQVVPAALLHDYKFRENLKSYDRVKLCADFVQALTDGRALAGTDCFRGDCPSRDDPLVLCPSGFWGYRHAIGFPRAVDRDRDFSIAYDAAPRLLMSVWKGDDFKLRAGHEAALKSAVGDGNWRYAGTFDDTLARMQEDGTQVVYFYCHGGLGEHDVPYLQVGSHDDEELITNVLIEDEVFWERPPLVFINGCHTTQLDPEKALDLVTGFLSSNAAGVIGTEITIFEPLATRFGEAFLRHLLRGTESGGSGTETGEALRLARLDLLQEGNPLGLVYIPFALGSLKLEKSAV